MTHFSLYRQHKKEGKKNQKTDTTQIDSHTNTRTHIHVYTHTYIIRWHTHHHHNVHLMWTLCLWLCYSFVWVNLARRWNWCQRKLRTHHENQPHACNSPTSADITNNAKSCLLHQVDSVVSLIFSNAFYLFWFRSFYQMPTFAIF